MEIKWFDVERYEEESRDYYEVELWENGDCDSRYFTWASEARACLRKAKPNNCNCIKFHSKNYGVKVVEMGRI